MDGLTLKKNLIRRINFQTVYQIYTFDILGPKNNPLDFDRPLHFDAVKTPAIDQCLYSIVFWKPKPPNKPHRKAESRRSYNKWTWIQLRMILKEKEEEKHNNLLATYVRTTDEHN